MTMTLNVRPGLSAPLVNSIPAAWDPQWFRRFITDFLNQEQLTAAGVTSVIAGTGIAVSPSTGDVTITNTGVTSIIAGTGVTITPTDGLGNVTVNAKVAALGAGPGISITSALSSVNWALGMTAVSGAAIIGVASDLSGNTLAVDLNGIVYKSTDGGQTWINFSTVTITGPGGPGGNLAWSAGTFVLAHDPTSVKTSTNGGLTWSAVSTGITGTFTPGYAANNGAGVWVITSNASPGTTHCYSISTDDAITFSTSANVSTPQFPNAPALWDGSQFVSFDDNAPSVLTSSTGATWTPTTSNSPNLQWASLATGAYVCALDAFAGELRVASTHDGLGTVANTTIGGLGAISITVAVGATVFAFDTGGSQIGSSLDSGATWSLVVSNFSSGDHCSAVCFDTLHSCFIAGGFLGGVISTVNSTLSGLVTISIIGGSGTVTSVDLADISTTPIYAVTGSPITTSGTIDLTLVTQSPHNVFAGPATGSTAAQPAFRLLVAGDLPAQSNNTVLGNVSGGSAAPIALSQTQLTTQVNVFTTSLSGAVPASGGGTTNFLRADGTFAAPAGAGGVTSISFGSTGLTPSTATTGAVVVAGTLAIGSGGTGQTAKAAAYNALSPMTTAGDLEYEASGPTAARLAIGSTGQVLTVVSGLPAWAPANAGTVTSIGSTTLTIAGTSAVPTVNLSTAQVTNIAAGGTALQTVSVIDSISGAGTSGSPLQLVGDSATPGNTMLYGTNGSGTKGWYTQPSGGAGLANPTATIGLTVINGTATTGMRSDGAPALSQAIVPNWTGAHTFSSTILATSVSLTQALQVAGIGTAAFGGFAGAELFSDGTRGAFQAYNRGSAAYISATIGGSTVALLYGASQTTGLSVGASGVSGLGPVAGALIDMTPDASTFTGTLTGMTATVTNTCVWSRQGNQVTIYFGIGVGTSNSTTFTMTGLPAAIQPARTQMLPVIGALESNSGIVVNTSAQITNSSTVTFFIGGSSTAWTNVLGKGISSAFSVTYLIN